MTDQTVDTQASEKATLLQIAASDPGRSVFVSANAGTGKTQVLTMRVLRLLLSGVDPNTILCVTYTRAAAAEMKNRLYERLSKWTICEQVELVEEMKQLGEHRPSQQQIETARSLFAHILDHEDGPRIETVHSFCQAVLKRFPVEANVPPDFQLLSEFDSERLLMDCFFKLLEQAGQIQEPKLAQALGVITRQTDETQALKHIKSYLQNRQQIHRLATDPNCLPTYERELRELLDVRKTPDFDALEQSLCEKIRQMPLVEIATALLHGGATQIGRGEQLQAWIEHDKTQKYFDIQGLWAVFSTNSGARRKKLTDKKVEDHDPDCDRLQNQIADMLEGYFKLKSAERCVQLSLSLTVTSVAVYRRFQSHKLLFGVLDYNDLIFFTEFLLAQEQMMAWVRWKLDQGINHLLIDEAQDTSPSQWSLLTKLSEPFFDGDEDSQDRTVFAVGDFKQSIYSFQGANPQIFAESQHQLTARATVVDKPFDVIDFTLSFRSSRAVLNFVDKVMTADEVVGLGPMLYQNHDVYRTGMPGLVEIWPVTVAEEETAPPMFDAPALREGQDSDALHAKNVVAHINALLDGSESEHFGRTIKPQDILILLRRRDSFFALLRAELERANLPVAGADRIVLNNQIEILDLLALGDVCLLPEDDLQLACLLKSPLIGFDEDDLFALAAGRDKASLFDVLIKAAATSDRFSQVAEKLNRWLGLADQLPVFEFFSAVLTEGGRQAFHRRLGPAVDDSLNAFLLQARDHGQQGQAGLSHFLNVFRQGASEIKRDMDMHGGGQIRVMSIHGAKGLEAPIVYLPDMLRVTSPSDSLVVGPSGLYWPPAATSLEAIDNMKEDNKKVRSEEDFRLLYVALTRARQALFISSWQKPRRRMVENSWYDILSRRMAECEGAVQAEDGGWRLATPGIASPEDHISEAKQELKDMQPPDWYINKPAVEPLSAGPLTPSNLGAQDTVVSFTAQDRKSALLRGDFVHRLFEILPDMAPELWEQAAARVAAALVTGTAALNRGQELPDTVIEELLQQTIKVMTDPRLAALFTPDALAEASLSGKVGDLVVQGQVDRLAVTEDQIFLADFKTGTPPGEGVALPGRYVRQMTVYAELLRQIYPDKTIACWLVWTQTAQISCITESERRKALDDILASF